MTNRVLVDAGPLVAIHSRRDQHHAACLAHAAHLPTPLLTSWPVIAEAAHLLRHNSAAVAELLGLFQVGVLEMLTIEAKELPQMLDLMTRYKNLGAQLADISLVYLAQREKIDTIFTLDRRDFSVYRAHGNRAFTIVP